MIGHYLDALDEFLAVGRRGLSETFIDRQTAFILSQQQLDGGFHGPAGGSDLYYTDMAARALFLLGSGTQDPWAALAMYVSSLTPASLDVTGCFDYLNLRRLLARRAAAASSAHALAVDDATRSLAIDGLSRQSLPAGGFARPGGTVPSAYMTFLAALSYEVLEMDCPHPDPTAHAIATLARPDGGFGDLPDASAGQTNATAAAVAVLSMLDAFDDTLRPQVVRFLLSMWRQGGLLAWAGALGPDLLSTYTGLLTLSGLDALTDVDLSATGRFLRDLAEDSGGFAGQPGGAPDVEYTYYGIAGVCLLRNQVFG